MNLAFRLLRDRFYIFYLMEKIQKEYTLITSLNNIIIFGAGKICDEILKKIILKQKDINFDIVDSSSLKINKSFHGKKIHSPEFIKNNDRKIFISAAQSYDEIYQKILQLQGGPSNILNGMII